MFLVTQHPSSNRLLTRLAEQAADVVMDELEAVDCPVKMVIATPGQAIPHVYFLDDGVASVVARSPEGFSAETGFIGREGFVLPSIALGVETIPHLCQMQIGGHGRRIPVARFQKALGSSRVLQELCFRFVQVTIVQTACTALSNAVHQVDERLARWLLMCHDRSSSDDIAITHEFMSVMLAVRRATVTTALHVLEGNGFLKSDRGYVQISDRPGLEAFAGDSYGEPEAEYRRLLGPL